MVLPTSLRVKGRIFRECDLPPLNWLTLYVSVGPNDPPRETGPIET